MHMLTVLTAFADPLPAFFGIGRLDLGAGDDFNRFVITFGTSFNQVRRGTTFEGVVVTFGTQPDLVAAWGLAVDR